MAEYAAKKAAAEAERRARPGQTFAADAIDPAHSPLDTAPMGAVHRRIAGAAPLNAAARAFDASGGLGVPSGARYGDRNRLYMFGAVSGRAVGLNLLHDTGAGWRGGGLSSDTGGFSGQRQAGLALRRGATQTSLSIEQEKTHSEVVGLTTVKDRRAMLTFSYTPNIPTAHESPPP
jgi:hypothetical protein